MAGNAELPLITKVVHQRDGRAESAFTADLDAMLRSGNKKLADFARQAQDTLSAALAIPRNAGGSLDLNVPQMRDAAAAQQAQAIAAKELYQAKLNLVKASNSVTQAERLEVAALKAQAIESERAAKATMAQVTAAEALQAELNRTKSATDRVVQATGVGTTANHMMVNSQRAARQASIQTGQQLQDLAISLYGGQRASVVFAQQLPQLAFALSGAGGRIGAIATLLSGPWSLALVAGSALLGYFIEKLIKTDDEASKATKTTYDFSRSLSTLKLDATAAAEAMAQLAQETRSAIQEQGTFYAQRGQTANQAVSDLAGQIAGDRAAIEVLKRRRTQLVGQAAASPIAAANLAPAIYEVQAALDKYNKSLAEHEKALKSAQAASIDATIGNTQRSVINSRDAQAAATDRYNEAVGALNTRLRESLELDQRLGSALPGYAAAVRRQNPNYITKAEYDQQLRLLKDQKDAADAIAKASSTSGARTMGEFINPVGSGPISGRFGEQRAGRAPGYRHGGIDIAVPVGTSVKAAAGGTVITSGTLPGYGNVVIVDHGGGTTTRYAHLSSLLAAKGDVIGQGQVLGLSGGARGAPGSGNSRGPHLHYEVRVNGKVVDPTKGLFPVDEAKTAGAIERAARDSAKAAEELQQVMDKANLAMIEGLVNSSERISANIQSLADEDMDNLIDATERFRDASMRAYGDTIAANDNLIEGLQETVRQFDQIGGAGRALGSIGAALVGIKTGSFSGVGGAPGLVLGQLLNTQLNRGRDRNGETTTRTLGEVFERVLDDVFGGQGKFIKVLDRAGIGLSAGSLIGKSNAGSALGGVLGGIGSDALAKSTSKFASSAFGKILGGALPIIGGLVGGLIGGLFGKKPTGSASVSNTSTTIGGNNADARSGAATQAVGIQSSISRIAEALGGTVGDYGFTIGQRGDEFRVSGDTGADVTSKNPKGNVLYKGKDAEEAARVALLNAIQDGAIKGIRQGAQRLLQAGKDLEGQLAKAIKFQNVFDELDAIKDPLGSAVRKLNREFEGLIDIFKEAGATTEEFASLEELYGLKRAEIIKQQTEATKQANEAMVSSLKDLIAQLTVGDSGLSLRDRLTNARAIYDPLAAAVANGEKVDYEKFTAAARDVIDIARQLYGSQEEYFRTFNEVLGLSKQALARENANATTINTDGLPGSPFTTQPTAANDNASLVSALDKLGLLLVGELGVKLDAVNSNLGVIIQSGLASGAIVPNYAQANGTYF